MPRSGTTLIEQVLSSLDGVEGAGETTYIDEVLEGIEIGKEIFHTSPSKPILKSEFIRNLSFSQRAEQYISLLEKYNTGNTRFVIDKMPHNFRYVGLISLLFPDAIIIHAKRHPIETALSAYRIRFLSGHYWSDDLKVLGQYYCMYNQIMQYWEEVIPKGKIITVHYEYMVTDLEEQSKRLAKKIGVEWSSKCLKFYKTKRPVRTASISQVRQPIYNSSLDRWKKYEKYLQPLIEEIETLSLAYEKELKEIKHYE